MTDPNRNEKPIPKVGSEEFVNRQPLQPVSSQTSRHTIQFDLNPSTEVPLDSNEDIETVRVVSRNPTGNTFKNNNQTNVVIYMDSVYKKYRNGSRTLSILNGCNLNCNKEQIYVLYGSVGAGKTTVIKTILHILPFDHGIVKLMVPSVARSNPIGYMPQGGGLYEKLSVSETIKYYGHLMEMSTREINKKLRPMNTILTIYNLDVMVYSLQTHQRKLLSLCIATLNDPDILILDDPTSGTDPLYKHDVWVRLKQLAYDEGVTIFLTTNEASECANADTVGYLRRGRIISEGKPSILLQNFNLTRFDELYYCIAVQELNQAQMTKAPEANDDLSLKSVASNESAGFVARSFSLHDGYKKSRQAGPIEWSEPVILDTKVMDRTRSETHPITTSLSVRNQPFLVNTLNIFGMLMRRVTRSCDLVLTSISLPIMIILLKVYVAGGVIGNTDVALVYQDADNCIVNPDAPACELLDLIKNYHIDLVVFDELKDAITAANNGKVSAILEMSSATLNDIAKRPQEAAPPFGYLKLRLNMAQYVESLEIKKNVESAITDFFLKVRLNTRNIRVLGVLSLGKPICGRYDVNQVVMDIWNVLTILTHLCGCLYGSLPYLYSRSSDRIDRYFVLGISIFTYHSAHWMVQIIYTILQNILNLIIVITILPMPLETRFSNVFLSFLSLQLLSICGIATGLVMYTFFVRALPVIFFSMVLQYFIALLCGFLWSYSALPYPFQIFAQILPHYAVANTIKTLLVCDGHLYQYLIFMGFLIPILWFIIFEIIYLTKNRTPEWVEN